MGAMPSTPAEKHLVDLAGADASRQRRMHVLLVANGWLLIPQCALIADTLAQVFVQRQLPALLSTSLSLLLAVMLLRALLGWLVRRDAAVLAEDAIASLRRDIWQRMRARGPAWLRQRSAAELAELALGHAQALHGYYSGYRLARMEVMAVPAAIGLAVAFSDWIAALVLVVAAPLIPVFMVLVGWGAEAAGRRQLQHMARLGGYFGDRLRGLGLIRLYGRGPDELVAVAAAAEGLRQRTLKVLRIAFLSSAVLEFFASMSVALVAVYFGLSYLGLLDLRGAPLQLRSGFFCLLLAPEFFMPLRRLAAHYHDRADALAAVAEVERHLGSTSPIPTPPAPAAPSGLMLSLRGVSLRPHGGAQPVLQQLSFDVPLGARIAVVGPSGCGKSTLLDALAGILPPDDGELRMAVDTRIAFAPQQPFLFAGSIVANLRLAQPDATPQQLRAAAGAAQVLRFADSWPQGLDSAVGERGHGLSGGEARRVALARAFLRDPHLLLLDEPTAFLDAATEQALIRELGAFAIGRTVLVATHSPTLMRWADHILHLPDGRMERVQ